MNQEEKRFEKRDKCIAYLSKGLRVQSDAVVDMFVLWRFFCEYVHLLTSDVIGFGIHDLVPTNFLLIQ